MRGNIGDYIIRGVSGEFYPCKPDIFHATYAPGEADDSHLAKENRRLKVALELADAALSGANMNMKAVERKVKQALQASEETHD